MEGGQTGGITGSFHSPGSPKMFPSEPSMSRAIILCSRTTKTKQAVRLTGKGKRAMWDRGRSVSRERGENRSRTGGDDYDDDGVVGGKMEWRRERDWERAHTQNEEREERSSCSTAALSLHRALPPLTLTQSGFTNSSI